ncbi:MAG: tetratricopeptide repeat protein [Candidatus Aminicenantes bacterium]|jgi:tetratricopeptide (TPR) repeat protein|nr:tetratricopeptide repeat protein [Candidatus Aminicenantes bacterium]
MILEPDGTEVDWFVGYSPPPEKYKEQVEKALQGIDTFQSLSAQYAKEPKNVEVISELASKYSRRNKPEKAVELFKQVVALDPEGKQGTTEFNNEKVTYTQNAEYNLGTTAISGRAPDVAPLQAFVKKYAGGVLVKEAYRRMSGYYNRTARKEEATRFFEEYTTRFPQDAEAYGAWVIRIISDKDPLDKGITLAQKAIDLTRKAIGQTKETPRGNPYQNLAQLYLLKGDKAKAAETADEMLKFAASLPSPSGPMSGTAMSPVLMAAPMAARIYVEAGYPDKALATYGPEFMKKIMENSSMLGRYAQFWSDQGQNLESALEATKKAIALTPDSYSPWNTMGQIYLKQKNYDEALKAAEKALSLAPDQPLRIKESIKKNIEAIKTAAQEKK